jgi:hypothetical protein
MSGGVTGKAGDSLPMFIFCPYQPSLEPKPVRSAHQNGRCGATGAQGAVVPARAANWPSSPGRPFFATTAPERDPCGAGLLASAARTPLEGAKTSRRGLLNRDKTALVPRLGAVSGTGK